MHDYNCSYSKNVDTILKNNITDFSGWHITYRVQNVIFAQGVHFSRYVPDRVIPDEIFFPTLGIMYVKFDTSIDIRYKRLCIKCGSGGEKLGVSYHAESCRLIWSATEQTLGQICYSRPILWHWSVPIRLFYYAPPPEEVNNCALSLQATRDVSEL